MKFNNKYRIKSARLPHWDYGNPGMYFVTICTKNFTEWFGMVQNREMILNKTGNIAENYWVGIADHFDNVELDEFIVMPNHIHGIIGIIGDKTVGRDVACNVSTSDRMSNISPKPKSLSTIIRSYKSAVTRSIRKHHNSHFAWQPRFYDHVIRNNHALKNIQTYIQKNPENWEKDQSLLQENERFISKLN